ncbi:MAG: endonuclease domain-containing protein [Candidatus Binataceae bacterium]
MKSSPRVRPSLPATTLRNARKLRGTQTEAERKLWFLLRNRRLRGIKFRRQFPVGPYIADFCCFQRKLIVELDGSQHIDNEEADRIRTAFLEARGYRVLRLWNHIVLEDEGAALEIVLDALGVG